MASKLFNYGAGIGSVFAGSRAVGKFGGYLPGMYTKSYPNVIEALNSSTANGVIEFGSAIVRDTSGAVPFARPMVSGDDAADVYGVAIIDVKTPTTISDNIVYCYHLGDQISVIRNGRVSVPVQLGTPTIGGQVYVRTAVSATNSALVIGGFEATYVSGENEPLLGWTFESAGYYPTDASASGSTTSGLTGLCADVKVCPCAQDAGVSALSARVSALENGTTPAGKASKLATAREIALTGAVTGTADFDGSADIAIATTEATQG